MALIVEVCTSCARHRTCVVRFTKGEGRKGELEIAENLKRKQADSTNRKVVMLDYFVTQLSNWLLLWYWCSALKPEARKKVGVCVCVWRRQTQNRASFFFKKRGVRRKEKDRYVRAAQHSQVLGWERATEKKEEEEVCVSSFSDRQLKMNKFRYQKKHNTVWLRHIRAQKKTWAVWILCLWRPKQTLLKH